MKLPKQIKLTKKEKLAIKAGRLAYKRRNYVKLGDLKRK